MHRKTLKQVIAQPYEEKAILQCIQQMLKYEQLYLLYLSSNLLFFASIYIICSSYEHPYGMVVAEFGREIINSFEGGDMGAVLNDVKPRLETFSRIIPLPIIFYCSNNIK